MTINEYNRLISRLRQKFGDKWKKWTFQISYYHSGKFDRIEGIVLWQNPNNDSLNFIQVLSKSENNKLLKISIPISWICYISLKYQNFVMDCGLPLDMYCNSDGDVDHNLHIVGQIR